MVSFLKLGGIPSISGDIYWQRFQLMKNRMYQLYDRGCDNALVLRQERKKMSFTLMPLSWITNQIFILTSIIIVNRNWILGGTKDLNKEHIFFSIPWFLIVTVYVFFVFVLDLSILLFLRYHAVKSHLECFGMLITAKNGQFRKMLLAAFLRISCKIMRQTPWKN